MKVIFNTKGRKRLEIEVFTLLALKHMTLTLVEYCERVMPEWAEIRYEETHILYRSLTMQDQENWSDEDFRIAEEDSNKENY